METVSEGGRNARAPRTRKSGAASVSEAAWRLLAVRARSRDELRRRLLHKGLPDVEVDQELERLQQQGYLDDAAFARAWVAARQEGRAPRGAALLRAELRAKGIETGLAREAIAANDEAAGAAIAARRRAAALAALPYVDFRRRLAAFLQRRGFGYDLVRSAVDAAWEDLHGVRPQPDEIR